MTIDEQLTVGLILAFGVAFCYYTIKCTKKVDRSIAKLGEEVGKEAAERHDRLQKLPPEERPRAALEPLIQSVAFLDPDAYDEYLKKERQKKRDIEIEDLEHQARKAAIFKNINIDESEGKKRIAESDMEIMKKKVMESLVGANISQEKKDKIMKDVLSSLYGGDSSNADMKDEELRIKKAEADVVDKTAEITKKRIDERMNQKK